MIVYGKQIAMHMLQKYPQKIKEVFFAKEVDQSVFLQIKHLNIPITRLDFKKAQAMARNGNHQGILMRITPLAPLAFSQTLSFSRLLVLCGVSDIGNIGSLVRSAYALGIDAIIFEGSLSRKALESVIRLSSGALLDLPFCFCPTLLDFIHHLKQANFQCYGAVMDGEDICKIRVDSQWALFLGSEGNGLSKKITQKMDKMIAIKMKNNFDSLNVGVAGGILMHRLVWDE